MKFTPRADELPTLGVGASLSFGTEPDPVQLARHPGGPSFVEYAGAVAWQSLEPALSQLKKANVPLLYHPSCLNLCGPYPNPTSWIQAVSAHVAAVDSAWLAQDVSICFVGDTPGYSIQLGYFIPPILTRESLAQAADRVREVTDRVTVPLLLEPAPVTFQLGDMTIFEWLGELARRTDCGLLLDAGHVVSHQLARGNDSDLIAGLEALDLDRVTEVHVAGGVLFEHVARGGRRRYYQDSHDLPILPETWQVFVALLERCPRLRAVCVECEGSLAQAILPIIQEVRQEVVDRALNPALREKVASELASGTGAGGDSHE